MMSDTDFTTFLRERERVSTAFVNGDATALETISTHRSPATIFGPKGDVVQGAQQVIEANGKAADAFDTGSNNGFEILHQHSSGDLGYWVGLQRSLVRVKGKGKEEPVPFDLRVTEIFRREEGGWKLMHRHADRLAEEAGG
jgi:ketosteroid isomerase-like protein